MNIVKALFTRARQLNATERDGDGDGVIFDGTPQERPASSYTDRLAKLRQRRGENPDGVSMAVTETPEFKRWFGDSKVVDDNGKPLVLYHVTRQTFREFTNPDATSNITMLSTSPEYTNLHVSDDMDGAQSMPVYVKAERPLDLREIPARRSDARNKIKDILLFNADDGTEEQQKAAKAIVQQLQFERDGYMIINRSFRSAEMRDLLYKAGYDSIVMNDHREGVNPDTKQHAEAEAVSWVVFDSRQIKSAIGNSGQFDPASPDISKALSTRGESWV